MSKKNLIIISNIEWGYLMQRHQHLALNLRQSCHVVFVESTAKRNPTWRDIPRILNRLAGVFGGKKKRDAVPEGVTVITPIVLPSTLKIFRFLNKMFFSRRLARRIKAACRPATKTALMTYLPSATVEDLIRLLAPDLLLYDCVSNFDGVAGMPPDTPAIEQRLVRSCDIVLTDCDFLYAKHKRDARRIELLEPGVDFALFNAIQGPPCRRVRSITYYGAINDKLDFAVLQYLAEQGLAVTLIGPRQTDHPFLDSARLRPRLDQQDLPTALADADALIIPYVQNEFMLGVIPAKFFECFATGKPLIVTRSENYRRYDDLILQGETAEEIYDKIRRIDRLENAEKQEQRLRIARTQDWRNLAARIAAHIDEETAAQ